MVVHLLKSTFSRGELSPKAYSRVDLELYEGGAEIVRNFYNVIHGGVRRRSGTRFAGYTKNDSGMVRFIPFVFNSEGDAYVLEFGHEYIRFWRDGGQVVDISDDPVEVSTDYDGDDIQKIQFAQTGDTMFLAHNDYFPQRLVRAVDETWSIDDVPFVDGPYIPPNDTGTTWTSSGNLQEGTTTTITASAATGINNGSGFLSTDVGRWVRMRGASKWVSGIITEVTDATHVDVTWQRVGDGTSSGDDVNTGGAGSATKSWRLGSFSATTGYPGCVAFYEGRLVWARTVHEPRTIYFSRSNLPYDYCPTDGAGTVTSEYGFYPTILAGLVDKIDWLCESTKLLIGTSSGIRTIAASDSSDALSVANLSQKLEIYAGAEDIMPVQAQEVVIYAERYAKNLRNIYFSFEQNSLISPVFTDLSDHLFVDGIREIAYQQVPEGIIWCLTEGGDLRGITYNREEKIIGFSRHDFGETVSGNGSKVKAISVIPGTSRDELWLCVERTIDGQTKRFVEVLDAAFEAQDQEDAFFVDCGLTYDGEPASVITGLDHLKGETVAILADGAVLPQATISDEGELTLPNNTTASKVQIGLPQVCELKLLRVPHQQKDGVILARKQRAVFAITEVMRTGGMKVGIHGHGSDDEYIRYRFPQDIMGAPPPLAEGPFRNTLRDSWEDGGQVYYHSEDPLPAFIRSVLTALDTEGE
jgi:hypothetical protein